MIEVEQENPESLDLEFADQLHKMSFEMKIVGLFVLLYGLSLTLSIILAPLGIPLLIAGKRLIDAAGSLKDFSESTTVSDLKRTFLFLRTYFRILFWILMIALASLLAIGYFMYRFFSPLFEMIQNSPLFS